MPSRSTMPNLKKDQVKEVLFHIVMAIIIVTCAFTLLRYFEVL
jgi:hypothetical protein